MKFIPFPVFMYMEKEDKWKLLRMIIRCNKVKKHKPSRVRNHTVKFDSLTGFEFPNEVESHRFYNRNETKDVRETLRTIK